MKIVQVIDQLGLGGAERVCVNLLNLLHRNGYTVKLVLFDRKGPLIDAIDKEIEISILNKKQGKLRAYKKLVKEVKNADVIHVHMRQTYRFVRKAFLLFGGHKKVILHDHYGRIGINQRVPMFYKNIFKPDYYIGCSQLLTDWAIQKIKIEPSNVFMVNNFVLKHPSNHLSHQGKGLVMVGSLKSVKNHEFAIRLAHALNEDLSIYCSKLGGDYYEHLLKVIETLNYSHRIHFITGCQNVQAELWQYQMAVLTSTSEGDPLVVMEYLAQGLPCICSNVGEAVKKIKQSFPFLVQDNFDLSHWVDAYQKAKTISSSDIERLYDLHFTEKRYLEKYLAIYQQFLST